MNQYHPSFEKSCQHLQITFTPEEYQRTILDSGGWNFAPSSMHDKLYWDKLPEYIVARCPLCGGVYRTLANTHTIHDYLPTNPLASAVFTNKHQHLPCEHFVATQTFLNLNGDLPTEIDTWLNVDDGDIPTLALELFLQDARTSAVIHSLPICRIEEGQFVPRYSMYIITYFAFDPDATKQIAFDTMWSHIDVDDGDNFPIPLLLPCTGIRSEPQKADLKQWVRDGRLHWLDLDDPDLPLKSEPVDDFPYAGIWGYGSSYVFRRFPKPFLPWNRKFWSPEGNIRAWGPGKWLTYPEITAPIS